MTTKYSSQTDRGVTTKQGDNSLHGNNTQGDYYKIQDKVVLDIILDGTRGLMHCGKGIGIQTFCARNASVACYSFNKGSTFSNSIGIGVTAYTSISADSTKARKASKQ